MEKSCVKSDTDCLARVDKIKKEIDKLENKIAQKESEKTWKQIRHF